MQFCPTPEYISPRLATNIIIIFFFQRIQLFSAYAMSTICQAGFDVIDLYPLTHSDPEGTFPKDIYHYPHKVFFPLETLLEKYKVNKNQRIGTDDNKVRIRRCTS